MNGGATFPIEPVRDAMDHVVASMVDNPNALLWLANLRDRDERSYRHTLRVALYLVAFGRQLGFPRPQLIRIGMIGLLADVGKARLPGAMFEKPGALTAAEFAVVKKHVDHSLAILKEASDVPEEVLVGVAQHHERMDGSGYPNALAGSQVSIYGRMAGIADCFSALTTERPYAEAMTPYRALTSLFEWANKSFHGPLVEQFVQAVGVFPVGSMIELSTGEVAVVLSHNLVRRLEPRVLILTDPDKQPLADPVAKDLLERSEDEDEQRVYILKGLAPGAYGIEPRDYYIDVSRDGSASV